MMNNLFDTEAEDIGVEPTVENPLGFHPLFPKARHPVGRACPWRKAELFVGYLFYITEAVGRGKREGS